MQNFAKKIGIIALVAVIGLGFIACSKKAGAQAGGRNLKGSPANHFVYDTDGKGGLIITRYIGPGGDVVIPAKIEGLPVTILGKEAFAGEISATGEVGPGHGITSIVIPESVWQVCNRCFRKNSTLQSVTFLGVNYHTKDMFESDDYKWLYIGEGYDYEYGQAFFVGDTYLGGLLEGSTNFGVFDECRNLKSVTFMGAPVALSHLAFRNCSNLEEFNYPESELEYPNIQPFYDESIIIESSRYGQDAFVGCTKLPMAIKRKLIEVSHFIIE